MKYIIEIENEPFGRNDDPFFHYGMDELYRAKGFKSLVFDQNGLDKLIPYTEPDRKAIEDEVWEFAKKVRLEEFIDEEGRLHGYISGFNSYSEAKAKYEAWKKQKEEIRVGDEVKYVEDHRKKIVVTSTYSDGWFDAIDSNGYLYINRNPVMWKKTGRHFPELIELLKKMGEESYV